MSFRNSATQKQSPGRSSVKKVVFKISRNLQENTALACNFSKREALAQVFSCEFWKIFKKIFS